MRAIYDAARKLLDLETSGGNLLEVAQQREALNAIYDTFVSHFGPITNKLNQKILIESAALPFLLALELDYQALTNTAQKARIFYDSTVRGVSLPEQIKDCQDAFLFCLNKTGGVDIDWRHIDLALEKGVMISIDPDAHSIEGFSDTRYGVLAAQKAMVTKEQNLSSMGLAQFENFIQERKAVKGI